MWPENRHRTRRQRRSSFSRRWLGSLFGFVLLGFVLLACAAPALAGEPLVAWRQDIMKVDDPGPRLDINSDGLVQVHVPAYLIGAGDFVFELEPAELAELRVALARLESFDWSSVRASRSNRLRQLAASGQVPAKAGAAFSHFEIAGVLELQWRDLSFDAGWVGDARLEQLAELEERFLTWTQDPRRQPVEHTP